MNPPRTAIRHGLGLSLAAGVGITLAVMSSGPQALDTRSAGEDRLALVQGASGVALRSSHTASIPTGQRKSEAFAQAWKLLHDRKMRPTDKRVLQMYLLKKWAEVDLDGALAAAAAVHDLNSSLGVPAGLFSAFRERMRTDPDAFWPALQENRYGLATADLQACWMEEVGISNPMYLADRLGDFGPLSRGRLISSCVTGLTTCGPEEQKRFLELFSSLPENPDNRALPALIGDAMPDWNLGGSTNLQSLLKASTNDIERNLLLDGLGKYLGSVDNTTAVKAQFDAVADIDKKAAALAAIAHGETEKSLRVMTDYLISQGDWTAIAENVPQRLAATDLSSEARGEFVGWADTLPERKETEMVYRAAVASIVGNQSAAEAREWLISRPEGWKRDNALAGYAVTADDTEAAWALEQISDDVRRAEAKQARDADK
ncbi:MAG: hypothetical protein QM755_21880 [Luteolibacter sp.]